MSDGALLGGKAVDQVRDLVRREGNRLSRPEKLVRRKHVIQNSGFRTFHNAGSLNLRDDSGTDKTRVISIESEYNETKWIRYTDTSGSYAKSSISIPNSTNPYADGTFVALNDGFYLVKYNLNIDAYEPFGGWGIGILPTYLDLTEIGYLIVSYQVNASPAAPWVNSVLTQGTIPFRGQGIGYESATITTSHMVELTAGDKYSAVIKSNTIGNSSATPNLALGIFSTIEVEYRGATAN